MPPKPSKENDSSPAKPILVTPPRADTEAFFFKKTNKVLGLTPKGTRRILLEKYEGEHHNRVRDLTKPDLILRGDQPLESPSKYDIELQLLRLDVLAIDLKKRSNHDYTTYIRTGIIDPGHFHACRVNIKENIQQIRTCYQLTPHPNKATFLAELNQRIAEGSIYNPFGLKQIYDPSGYQSDLAQDPSIFQRPIKVGDIILPPRASSIIETTVAKPPVVFAGLYDGIDGIGDIFDGSCGSPPRKRRLDFLSGMSASAAAEAVAKPDVQDGQALATP